MPGKMTNYEKFASTPEKVASLVNQFRCVNDVDDAWREYVNWVGREPRGEKSYDDLLTEWLQEECDA